MSNIFDDNQKQEIRYTNSKQTLVLYNPNEQQKEELKQMVSEIEDNMIPMNLIRYIFREMVKDGNIVDEFSDEELQDKINNCNRDMELLIRELKDIVLEIQEDILYEATEGIKTINAFLNIANGKYQQEIMEQKINKFFKKHKIQMTYKDFEKVQNNPEEIMKIFKIK